MILLRVVTPPAADTHRLDLVKQGQLVINLSCTHPRDEPRHRPTSPLSPGELAQLAALQLQMDDALSLHSEVSTPTTPSTSSAAGSSRAARAAADLSPDEQLELALRVSQLEALALAGPPALPPRRSWLGEPKRRVRTSHARSVTTPAAASGSSSTSVPSPSSTFDTDAQLAALLSMYQELELDESPSPNQQLGEPERASPMRPKPVVQTNSETRKREFSAKVQQLYALPQLQVQDQSGVFKLTVRRAHLVEDSYSHILRVKPQDLKRKLLIKFDGEEAIDLGGVAREFFDLLSREVFNVNYGHFTAANESDNMLLQINPSSGVANPEHLWMFRFIGRLVAAAILHRRFLSAHLVPSFYKMILGRPIGLDDLETIDEEHHRGLKWMLSNSIVDVIDETFTTTEDQYGKIETIELQPGGSRIKVTDTNKQLYVDLIAQYRVQQRVHAQFKAFLDGFTELVPPTALANFDERDLELLICGVGVIDVDDWERCTVYRGYLPGDAVVRWFWECVRSWPDERKSRLLQFVTGTSRIPVNGFKDLHGSDGPRQFLIERCGASDTLPKSHTCFNRLDLPPYESSVELEWRLTTAIE